MNKLYVFATIIVVVLLLLYFSGKISMRKSNEFVLFASIMPALSARYVVIERTKPHSSDDFQTIFNIDNISMLDYYGNQTKGHVSVTRDVQRGVNDKAVMSIDLGANTLISAVRLANEKPNFDMFKNTKVLLQNEAKAIIWQST